MLLPARYTNLAFTYIAEGAVFAERPADEALRLAATMARRAVDCDPDDADALSTLGFATWSTGNRQEAHKWLSLVNDYGANSAWATGMKGVFLVWSGNGAEGRDAGHGPRCGSIHTIRATVFCFDDCCILLLGARLCRRDRGRDMGHHPIPGLSQPVSLARCVARTTRQGR